MTIYKLLQNPLNNNRSSVVVKDDTLFIPFDDLNPDFLEYVAWLFEGNQPESDEQ